MATDIRIQPDITQAVCEVLRLNAALTALVAPGNITTTVAKRAAWPALRVVLGPGNVLQRGYAWRPTVDLHAYANTDAMAWDVIATAEQAFCSVTNTTAAGSIITSVDVVNTPIFLPDTSFENPAPRYVLTFAPAFHTL